MIYCLFVGNLVSSAQHVVKVINHLGDEVLKVFRV